MALSNSQYNAIMRRYQQQQFDNKHRQDERVLEVYDKVPAIRELDQAIRTQSAAMARRALLGDRAMLPSMRTELEDLREQKRILLQAGGFAQDYMEMHYRCANCQDTGYRNDQKCHCFQQERIQMLYAQSNIREVLERENFNTYSYRYFDDEAVLAEIQMTVRQYMQLVVNRCQQFAREFKQNGGNLLFTGSTGVGKTFLTNCIAKALIDNYQSVIYLSSHDLFDIFSKHRFSYNTEEELEEMYQDILECDMLIIDDLGTEVNNTFVSSQLFYCINERINRKKGTIISTNLSMDMLRDVYSDRITSRLMSHYQTIPLYGADIRVGKRHMRID